MGLAEFQSGYGAALPGTAAPPDALGLASCAPLVQWTADGLGGVYRRGLLSMCSVRENGGELGNWSVWLPAGTRLFASSAFGFLFCTRGADLWVVDPQNGLVTESDVPLVEALDLLCETGVRRAHLREPLLRRWHAVGGADPVRDWLCPVPALALGGGWQVASLKAMAPGMFLSFTAGLFDRSGKNAVQVRRLPAAPPPTPATGG